MKVVWLRICLTKPDPPQEASHHGLLPPRVPHDDGSDAVAGNLNQTAQGSAEVEVATVKNGYNQAIGISIVGREYLSFPAIRVIPL